MSFMHVDYRYRSFQPAAVGSGETTAVFSVSKGERVVWASYLPLIASAGTTSTLDLGDGTGTTGFIAALDLDTNAAGTPVSGAGTFLANSGGKLYTVDDTVDAVYTTGATPGATNPKGIFCIAVVREWPG